MRAAYICQDCTQLIKSRGLDAEQLGLLEGVAKLLDRISLSSRAHVNILDHLEQSNLAATVFDVFLCHSSEDKPEVRRLATGLRDHGLEPWLDEEQLLPGVPWQDELERQIGHIKSAAVCIGASGRGPWQRMELRGFLSEFVDRGCPVIPVVLSTVTDVPELPIFLRQFTWVDFRQLEPDPWQRLRLGITGRQV